MNTNDAIRNLDSLIATSRLTREEHVALEESLKCLAMKTRLLDTQEQEAKNAAEAVEKNPVDIEKESD